MKLFIKNKTNIAMAAVFLSAVFYAVCIPIAKLLTPHISSVTLGGLLYLGAGLGLAVMRIFVKSNAKPLTKKEMPYMSAVVALDISAIILLMLGISKTSGANASLLENFELVSTSIFAYFIFKEKVSKKLLTAILFITIASTILTFEGRGSFDFNIGSLFVILAYLCWGLENNCTRMLSTKSTKQITEIKGLCSGCGSLIIAFIMQEHVPAWNYILWALALGFISYGLSVTLFIYAQRYLGAVKTAAYYSIAPFAGIIFSLLILGEVPPSQFYIALIIMILGTYLVIRDTKHS